MLELLSGFLSLLLGIPPQTEVQAANWNTVVHESLVLSLLDSPDSEIAAISPPDPIAAALMQQHIAAMASQGYAQAEQGIWIASNQVLAEHLGTAPLPAASLTKIPTTLVALATWGTDYQFETIVATDGQIQDGVLQGNLIIQGSNDPFFVWEEAIGLGNTLNQMGIRQVSGDLVIMGNFAMNFETDPLQSGAFLKQGLDQSQWSNEVETQYQTLPPDTPRPSVAITGTVRLANAPEVGSVKPIVLHQSLPLFNILKRMNIYSNNVIADMLADNLGGAGAMAQKAAELANVPVEEIRLQNGSGLGEGNQISPRAVTAMLIATQQYLQPRQLSIADLYPIIGNDGGTLLGRQIPAGAVLKTGTLNRVSSLAGVIPTQDQGLIWFTIINLGVGDLQIPHAQQDLLLQQLQAAWGNPTTLPPSIAPNQPLQNSFQLGTSERNRSLL
ncbi:D-alanyl-D-alanine carboxypeptidase [Egbenema bharatensis]|uniref:D-alanyl-D-alanine carboxypeptidase n=1 Tax=Egbenema bharatensis TaxID=3463334 RepID=UPI003A88158B